MRKVWEMKSLKYRERDQQTWATDHRRRIYRPSVILDRWGVKVVSRHLSSRCWEKATSTDHVSRSCRGKKTPEARYDARSIHQVSRSCQEVKNFLDWFTRCRGAVEITIRKSLGSSTDSYLSRRCRASFSKTVFREEKNTDMNAIKYATQPMIQITF